MIANCEVRSAIMDAGLRNFEIAEALKMHETSFSRLLRKPVSEETKLKILATVAELVEQRKNYSA